MRRLGTADAVVVGLGAMLGAGVFAAFAPAAAAAGSGLLVGLVVAAVVASCNAASSAQLAAVHPASGGTYVYGRERLHPLAGYVAGWAFVVGKTASLTAIALTFGAYAVPGHARVAALAAVAVAVLVDAIGVRASVRTTRVIVAIVIAVLLTVVITSVGSDSASVHHLEGWTHAGLDGILEAAGFLFFAFAGYARIATLGEEVRDPARTIPRAVPVALGIVLVLYAAVAVALLVVLGPTNLATSSAPLDAAVRAAGADWLAPVVRAGAALAAFGVLLSLLGGVARTVFAMAADGGLPLALAAVHPTRRVPHVATIAIGVVVAVVVALADLRGAIGFSSFGVLVYYAIANAAALTLPPDRRPWPRWLAGLGLIGCVVLAVMLPATSVVVGTAVVGLGAVVWVVLRRSGRTGPAFRSS